MAAKVEVDVELKYKEAAKNIQQLNKEIKDLKKDGVKANEATAKSIKGIEKSSGKAALGIKGIGTALKAAGIGLAIAAFAKLVEVFNENQKVADFFSTTFEVLSLAFNDFFNFLDNNVGTITGYFKAIFDDPVQSLKDLGIAIRENITERFNSALEMLGFVGDAIKKVFQGDWEGAMESAKLAGKEYVDVLTGVDGSFDKIVETTKSVVNATIDYTKSTIKAAQSIVELNKQAELSAVINQGLIEKYDRQAEQQRQIRDDDTKNMADRIAANVELGRILEEQETLMLANVDIQIAAAQAQYNKNKNQENEIALQEALNEQAAVKAQIEGFRSEQLINEISLKRELNDLEVEAAEKKIEDDEKLLELQEQKKQKMLENLDTIRNVAGQESAIGKALFAAKTAMLVKEQIEEAKATLSKITMKTAEASVATATGVAETAKVGFPQNIPLIIAFAAQAAGIFSAINSAVGAAKSSIGSVGGAVGGGASASAAAPSIPPAFNVVGAAPENQLSQAIGDQQQTPIQAFVVGSEVTTQQALDRNIVDNASLG